MMVKMKMEERKVGVVVEITIRIKVEEVAKMVVKMVGVGLDFPWMLKMVTMVMVIGSLACCPFGPLECYPSDDLPSY